VETGTHDELTSKRGAYYGLVKKPDRTMTKDNDDRPELRSERMRQVMGNIPQMLLVWGTVGNGGGGCNSSRGVCLHVQGTHKSAAMTMNRKIRLNQNKKTII
jgi:hypothetical protein